MNHKYSKYHKKLSLVPFKLFLYPMQSLMKEYLSLLWKYQFPYLQWTSKSEGKFTFKNMGQGYLPDMEEANNHGIGTTLMKRSLHLAIKHRSIEDHHIWQDTRLPNKSSAAFTIGSCWNSKNNAGIN